MHIMGLLDSFFGKSKEQPAPNSIRETLFGDMPLEQWPREDSVSKDFPWSAFASARSHLAAGNQEAAIDCWRQVTQQPDLEPRQHLQAWHFLRQHGQQASPEIAKQVMGVIIEVGMPGGLDIIAAYKDGSARYYNFSGAVVIWEHPDTSLDPSINPLFEVGNQVVNHIGVWNQPRPPAPSKDHARISFLTPGGLHFGQGPFTALSKDTFGGPMLKLASGLMRALIAKTKKS
jgi:hypothetical protein